MQAMTVRRLGDSLLRRRPRLYLDGKRVDIATWALAHHGRKTDSYASRMFTRADGSVIVREYHCIRA